MENKSSFSAKPLPLFIFFLAKYITIIFTLGILYPIVFCYEEKYIVEHTIIDGKKLKFDGKLKGIYWEYLKWLLLCYLTLGLFTFNLSFKLKKWKCANTSFINYDNTEDSKFTGLGIDNYYIKMSNILIVLISFGLLTPYAILRKYKWVKTNTYINGQQLQFNADKKDLYLHYLKWYGLIIITLGIYLIWFFKNQRTYTISCTNISTNQEKIDVSSPTNWLGKLLDRPLLFFTISFIILGIFFIVLYSQYVK